MTTPDELTICVASLFQMTPTDLFSPYRTNRITQARYALAWGLRKMGWSLESIGVYLDRDHTTIIYGLERVEKEAKTSPKLAARLVEIERMIDMEQRPTIVCLCGSTRFSQAFQDANLRETLDGKIVLSIGCDMRSDTDIFGHLSEDELIAIKERLDQLHLRKIDMADEVLILNVGGYIGQSTARELAHARALGKRVRFLEGE